jgi:hypothetical protein
VAEIALYQALAIFAWFPLIFTLAVALLIARFYARASGKHTFWQLYLLPMVGYGLATIREAALLRPGMDPVADLLEGASGLLLTVIAVRLYLQMMRQRTPSAPVPQALLLPTTMLAGMGGPLGVAVLMAVLASVTQRMQGITKGPPYQVGFYAAAALSLLAAIVRIPISESPNLSVIYPVLTVLSHTLGAVMAWRTWSWLFAERG